MSSIIYFLINNSAIYFSEKYLLALRALKRAYNIDKENPDLLVKIIQFKLKSTLTISKGYKYKFN